MSKLPTLEELMKAGAHFGHKKSKWHPKMKPYIFIEKGGVHVIDLEKTQEALQEAYEFVKTTVANGGNILFLGTKKQAAPLVKEAALACNMPYIISRWLGGTFTNAKSVLNLVKKYNKLREEVSSGLVKKYTKKEQLLIEREIERLEKLIGGIANITKVPDAIFIVDIKQEKTALQEATSQAVPIVAICDTNVNPEKVDYPIPANDDATNSIRLITNFIAEAVNDGKKAAESAK